MKLKDIRNMGDDELKSKIAELERELNASYAAKERGGGKTTNYGKIKTLKRNIARIKTILRERELGLGKSSSSVQSKK
ncbi:MAG: 50S ribosomal protein L29 [Candidatus Micrarchaeota archaeon]|nr:50S ribosomal protein L29 [Candidatus Micrarchaeota archaeon]